MSPLSVSGDGKWLAVQSSDLRLLLIPHDNGRPRVLAHLEPLETVYRWGPGDRSVFTYKLGKQLEVFEVSMATGGKRLVRSSSLGDTGIWSIVLSRDGRAYAYTYMRIVEDLYLMDSAPARKRSFFEWAVDLFERPGHQVRWSPVRPIAVLHGVSPRPPAPPPALAVVRVFEGATLAEWLSREGTASLRGGDAEGQSGQVA
jgi:hypothetical protein